MIRVLCAVQFWQRFFVLRGSVFMTVQNISIKQEPEIQFDGQSAERLQEVENWILAQGGKATKTAKEDSPYFDTRNNRLIREGMECRLKIKDGVHRTDLKTPLNTEDRVVVPDHMGVIWRHEICMEASKEGSTLCQLAGLSILQPVQKRVSRIFEKPLHVKFRAQLSKRKFERKIGQGNEKGVIEYSLQRGRMATPDGKRKSEELFIVEIELRNPKKAGSEKALKQAIDEFKEAFSELELLKDRKVLIGFKLIEPDMELKARSKFRKMLERPNVGQAPGLEAA